VSDVPLQCRSLELHPVQHPFHQSQASPCTDFTGCELDLKVVLAADACTKFSSYVMGAKQISLSDSNNSPPTIASALMIPRSARMAHEMR
jgi:hypothetical protein